jgi:hypothetical protein
LGFCFTSRCNYRRLNVPKEMLFRGGRYGKGWRRQFSFLYSVPVVGRPALFIRDNHDSEYTFLVGAAGQVQRGNQSYASEQPLCLRNERVGMVLEEIHRSHLVLSARLQSSSSFAHGGRAVFSGSFSCPFIFSGRWWLIRGELGMKSRATHKPRLRTNTIAQ